MRQLICGLVLLLAAPAFAGDFSSSNPAPAEVSGTAETALPASCKNGQTRYDTTQNSWVYCSSNTWIPGPGVPLTRNVSAGAGLTGGGSLGSDLSLSLPTVAGAGTYGDATHFPNITIDAYGRVTSVGVQPTTASGPARPALVGDETIVMQCNDAGTSLANTGSAGGSMTRSGAGASQYQAIGTFSYAVRSATTTSTFGCWTGITTNPSATGFTMQAWIIASSDTGAQVIFEKPNTTSGSVTNDDDIQLGASLTPAAVVSINGSNVVVNAAHSIAVGVPTLISATWDGSTLRLYVNGLLEGSTAAAGTLDTWATTWTLAGRPAGAGGFAFTGRLWEVRVNPSVLSQSTIAAQYAAGMGFTH